MAMSSQHQDFISNTAKESKIILDQYGELSQLNVLWAGSPNYQNLITQAEIDSVQSFAGAALTKQQLSDAVYALEQVRGIITAALPALTVLAHL